jgi:hypothetical protein
MFAFAIAAMILSAGTQDAAPATTPSPAPTGKAKRICRREAPIGSIMPHQTCFTHGAPGQCRAQHDDPAGAASLTG